MQKWGDCIGDSTIFGVDAVNMKGGEASRPSRESGRPRRGRMSVGHGTERMADVLLREMSRGRTRLLPPTPDELIPPDQRDLFAVEGFYDDLAFDGQ